jgi:hypothetical protein
MRSLNKTCSKCGYQTHRLFDISDEGEYGICGNCVLDIVLEAHQDEDEYRLEYIVGAIESDAEQA